jgi:hypothetical protein
VADLAEVWAGAHSEVEVLVADLVAAALAEAELDHAGKRLKE